MAKANDGRRMPKKDYEARVPLIRADLVQMQVALQQAQFSILLVVAGDMLALTHRPNAPWHLVPANNKRFARLEILKTSCRQIAAALEA